MLNIRFNPRFFNPLSSSHKMYYIELLLYIEKIIEDSGKITVVRGVLLEQLRRFSEKNDVFEDLSNEDEYKLDKYTGDHLIDNLAFVFRYFKNSGWIDVDESDGYSSDLIFITHHGKELIKFFKKLMNSNDQSGHVLNTFNNISRVCNNPPDGYICIKNAYDSTQELLTSLEMMYSKIKEYYVDQLKNIIPEDVLKSHFDGYIHDVIDTVLFPIKVDDSIDRFKGPIIDEINLILSNTKLINQISDCARQTKCALTQDEVSINILKMLNYIKNHYTNIGDTISQLDDKNNLYIRVTRQKLAYMLNMDTSIKGNIISILTNSKNRSDDFVEQLNNCIQLYDIDVITEDSFYKKRKPRDITKDEQYEPSAEIEVSQDDISKIVETYGAGFTKRKINNYVSNLLVGKGEITSSEFEIDKIDDYLMSVFIMTNSSDYECDYTLSLKDGGVDIEKYRLPKFTLSKRKKM